MNCACTKKFYEIFIPALAGLYTGQSIFYLSAKKSALKRAPLKEMKKMSTSAIADVRGRVHETSKADPLSSLKRQWSAVFVSTATLGIAAGVVGLGINALFRFS
jgi:hypothetical protein